MLKLGELNINSLYVGESSIKRIYIGENLIYQELIEDDGYRTLVYTPGSNVKLVGKAEYFDSIIADGEELQDGSKSKSLTVPTLENGNIKVKFKEELTSLLNCFYSCSALTAVPNNLFSNCIEVTTFQQCFNGCLALTAIPENLFINNTKVTRFDNCFNGCSSLTSIPVNLFTNNTMATTFERCFFNCSSLISIPTNLFINNTKVTSFGYCFYNCTSLTSACPIDNDGTPIYNRSGEGKDGYTIVTYYPSCFNECSKMSDYTSIPSSWGGGAVNELLL